MVITVDGETTSKEDVLYEIDRDAKLQNARLEIMVREVCRGPRQYFGS